MIVGCNSAVVPRNVGALFAKFEKVCATKYFYIRVEVVNSYFKF